MNRCLKKNKVIFSPDRNRRPRSSPGFGRRILVAAFLVFSFASAPFLFAQEGPAAAGAADSAALNDLKPEGPASMAKEPPLTQADIDAIIKVADSDDDKPVEDLGINPLRLELALTKVSFGMLILAGADPKLVYGEDVHEVFVLSQEELNLIAANLNRIAGIDFEQ